MTSKIILTPGQSLSGHTIISAGDSIAGHVCWNVTCNTCQQERNVRSYSLRKGIAKCPCQSIRQAAKQRIVPQQDDITDKHYALVNRVSSLEAELAEQVESLRSANEFLTDQLAALMSKAVAQTPPTPQSVSQTPQTPQSAKPAPPRLRWTSDAAWQECIERVGQLVIEHTDPEAFRWATKEARTLAEQTQDYSVAEARGNVVTDFMRDNKHWLEGHTPKQQIVT